MKDKLKQRKILIVVLAVILTLSVGYAIFSESLNISGSASTGSTNFNIVFDRVGSIREVEASSTTADIKENGKKLEINVPGLSMPTAYAVIPVTIKNKGDITAKVKEIRTEGLDTTDIKVTYEGLAKEDIFNPNDEKEVNIKVIWDRSSTSTSVEATFSIEIVYEQVTGEIITTTTEEPIVDNRFVFEGTKLVRLTPEGEEYFKNPENTEVIIPEGTTEIGNAAFIIPTNYTEEKIPDFDYIWEMTEKYPNGDDIPPEEKEKYDTELAKFEPMLSDSLGFVQIFSGKTLRLPEGLKKIGMYSFAAVPFKGDLTLPNSVTKIGGGAFTATEFNGTLKLPNNLKTIEGGTFSNTKFTGDLIIPDSVTEIGSSAFDGTTFNGTLTLSNNLKTIYSAAFYNSLFTGELYIPDSVLTIEYGVFQGCNNLTSVSVSSNTLYEGDSFPKDIPITKR